MAAAQAPRKVANLFDDLESEDVSFEEAAPEAPGESAVDFRAPGMYVPPQAASKASWPADICSDAEAHDALKRALRGLADPRPLSVLAAKVLESLSDLERRVLAGEPQPIDVGPIERAAVMRLRVADALSSTPPTGSLVDTGALSATLGQIDALLAEVAPLLQGAPEELAPALESIRNSLVSEAIDFSEAAQRVAAQTQQAEAAKAVPKRVAQARVLSVAQETEADRADARRRVGFITFFVLVALLAAGFHGYGWWKKSLIVSPPPPVEIPAGYTVHVTTGRAPIVLHRSAKVAVDKAALQKFKEAQEALGRDVNELPNGDLVVIRRGSQPPGSGGK